MKELFHLYEFIARKTSPEEWKRIKGALGKRASGIPKTFEGKVTPKNRDYFYGWKAEVVSLDEIRIEVVRYVLGKAKAVQKALVRWEFEPRVSKHKMSIWTPRDIERGKREPSCESFPHDEEEARLDLRGCLAYYFNDSVVDALWKALEYQMKLRFPLGLKSRSK